MSEPVDLDACERDLRRGHSVPSLSLIEELRASRREVERLRAWHTSIAEADLSMEAKYLANRAWTALNTTDWPEGRRE